MGKLAAMDPTSLGIDIGAETIKVVTVSGSDGTCRIREQRSMPHNKEPHAALRALLSDMDLSGVQGVAVTGRLRRVVAAEPVPSKAALRRGVRVVHPELARATVVSVGAHGFAVLEILGPGQDWYQQNSRCSQGTGNFLSQLVRRFGLDVEEASELCDTVAWPAALSGRCPVILKTDMTHLANKGEDRARILAGLYDAVCENVLTLVRPRLAPPDVVLVGGVARSERVRRTIGSWLAARGMSLRERRAEDEHIEAIGAAVHALEHGGTALTSIEGLRAATARSSLERVPPLTEALTRVHRMSHLRPAWHSEGPRIAVMGLDIGSTGSKAVLLDLASREPLWEAYMNTEGAPVTAAQRLLERWRAQLAERTSIVGFGVTGSGREVVGSLLRSCYGTDRVFVINEIAAHARGATELDPEVDTIFEIGGQDAKYIRLEQGRVIDAAMNEACSAGTGSFIAEQGAKFEGVGEDVRRLSALALEAREGVSLGQHCSVFMAEVIDEAITEGVARESIIAGLYDSVIQNYLNRVKGTRTIGSRIFCQGMPFSSDALAAAVARQTDRDVVVPPNPGTIGALGIALLLGDELGRALVGQPPVDPALFLEARVSAKETIICRSVKGCGEPGNKCRIDRLTTLVAGREQRFLWGGNCSLYDRGAGRSKLPDRAPDPFRDRELLLDALMDPPRANDTRPSIGLSDEFALKQLAPLFVVFLQELGFRCEVLRSPGAAALRSGIEGARVPYCAPVQMMHGVYFELATRSLDFILLPMVKALPRVGDEEYGTLCPMVIALPDLLENLLPTQPGVVLRPVVEIDAAGIRGTALAQSLLALAERLHASGLFECALARAIEAQERFDADVLALGSRALAFCSEHDVVPVAVLGRPYTIYNDVLNSNVPSILRSLGALPIPVDCVPLDEQVPVFHQQYWSHTQRNLRAADYVRRTPGLYSVFCSNYACGPDSFTLHFYSYIMQNKPFAVVETDGHSGDAGTKTRMEAFLYCVDADRRSGASERALRADFKAVEERRTSWNKTRAAGARAYLPRMGPGSLVAAGALRGEGLRAQALPPSTREDVRTGRKYTSGKECVPMMLTLGTLLNELERSVEPNEPVSYFMPTAHGPCRFGVYHGLHKIALERAGWGDRVSLIIPDDSDYYEGMSPEFAVKLWLGFVAHDLLEMMLLDVRPVERRKGAANALYRRYLAELIRCMERPPSNSALRVGLELLGGMWGTRRLLARAAKEYAEIKDGTQSVPTVALVGEIYVRLDPFANDFIVQKLEQRGLRVRFAPFIEWMEYSNYVALRRVIAGTGSSSDDPLTLSLTDLVQRVTLGTLYPICAQPLGWAPRLTVPETVKAASPYVHPGLAGEAQLTVGGPLCEFEHGLIDGVVIVGPHECMPCKIAEAQYGLAAERTGIPYLTISVNGDPIDTEVVDRFAYDIRQAALRRETTPRSSRLPVLQPGCSADTPCAHAGTCPGAGATRPLAQA
jgi:predicted CoA-substrate-specific enzyme activase